MSGDLRSSRIGVFGGTFDPFHLGHLIAGQDVLEALRLDRILLVPARRSPHKADEPLAPPEARLRMLREAVAEDPRFGVCDVELLRGGTSYTVDTLAELDRREPEARLFLVLGVDQWAGFDRWRRPREIARLAELAVMTREGAGPRDANPAFADGPAPPFREVPVTRVDISSTRLRRRVREGGSLRYLVPEPVLRIIEAEKLYLSVQAGS